MELWILHLTTLKKDLAGQSWEDLGSLRRLWVAVGNSLIPLKPRNLPRSVSSPSVSCCRTDDSPRPWTAVPWHQIGQAPTEPVLETSPKRSGYGLNLKPGCLGFHAGSALTSCVPLSNSLNLPVEVKSLNFKELS